VLAGLLVSTAAAVVLVAVVGAGLGLLAVLPPLFVVVASRGAGLHQRHRARCRARSCGGRGLGRAGACMFGGGILVSPLLALGEGSALPMAAVVAGGAVASLLAAGLLARSRAAAAVVE
jgi:DHA1 family bicyclomycin/chloramphenicol resistance-like MFS transporter